LEEREGKRSGRQKNWGKQNEEKEKDQGSGIRNRGLFAKEKNGQVFVHATEHMEIMRQRRQKKREARKGHTKVEGQVRNN